MGGRRRCQGLLFGRQVGGVSREWSLSQVSGKRTVNTQMADREEGQRVTHTALNPLLPAPPASLLPTSLSNLTRMPRSCTSLQA